MTILAYLLSFTYLETLCLQNSTAYRVFHDVLTDFTKAFYFQNVIRFHGARMNVILFTPFPLASIFTNLVKYQQYYVQISLCRKSPRSTVNVESTHRNSFTSRKWSVAFTASIFMKLTVTQFLHTSVPNVISSVRPAATYPPAQRHIPVDGTPKFIYLCSLYY